MIVTANTTITVYRRADTIVEAYAADAASGWHAVSRNVTAALVAVARERNESIEASEQVTGYYNLQATITPEGIYYQDRVKDDQTGITYEVAAAHETRFIADVDYQYALLRLIEGLV